MLKKQKRKNSPSNEESQSNGAPPLKKHTHANTSSIPDNMFSTAPILLSNIPPKAAPHACFFPHIFNKDGYVIYDSLPETDQDSEDEKERNQEVQPFFIQTRSRIKNHLREESENKGSQETDIFSQLATSLAIEQSMLKNEVINYLNENIPEIIKFFRNHSETQLRRCNARQLSNYITKLESNHYDSITNILTIYAFQKIYNRPVEHRSDGCCAQPVQMSFSSNAQPVIFLDFTTKENKTYRV